MCGSLYEAWRGGVGILLVTLLVIYLNFKAHITSMATTAFCSDTSSIWFGLSGTIIGFQQDNDPTHLLVCKGYLTKNESDGVLHQTTWPPQSPDLNPIEMVWNELDFKGKEKQPTIAQHMWELLQDCWKSIPLEAG